MVRPKGKLSLHFWGYRYMFVKTLSKFPLLKFKRDFFTFRDNLALQVLQSHLYVFDNTGIGSLQWGAIVQQQNEGFLLCRTHMDVLYMHTCHVRQVNHLCVYSNALRSLSVTTDKILLASKNLLRLQFFHAEKKSQRQQPCASAQKHTKLSQYIRHTTCCHLVLREAVLKEGGQASCPQ